MRTNLYAAVCCLEREAATAERKAPLLDAEGRHDDAFAAREVAASCRLAAGLLRAEERRRYDKEMLDRKSVV